MSKNFEIALCAILSGVAILAFVAGLAGAASIVFPALP